VDNVAGDVRVLREKIDETNVRITSIAQELEAFRLAIPQQTGLPPQVPGEEPPGEAAPPPAQLPIGMTPQQLFDRARADFFAGHWGLALEGFETYVKMFPRTEFADDAQYYIGDTYYSQGDFESAVRAYDRVISDYPDGDKVPGAYYKRGLSLQELGLVDLARQSFEFAVKNYPDTPAGIMAKQRLDRLNQRRE
jgi:tol-pal system protein YbgF